MSLPIIDPYDRKALHFLIGHSTSVPASSQRQLCLSEEVETGSNSGWPDSLKMLFACTFGSDARLFSRYDGLG